MDFIGSSGGEEGLELIELQCVVGTAAGGVDQNEVAIGHGGDGIAQVLRTGNDSQRRADDVGVFLELIDGGDSVGVNRDQTNAVFFAQMQVGGELGDRCGFA